MRPLQLSQMPRGKFFLGLPRHFAQREPVGPGKHRFQIEIVGQPVFVGQLEGQEPRPREGEAKLRPTARQFALDRPLGTDLTRDEQEIGHEKGSGGKRSGASNVDYASA